MTHIKTACSGILLTGLFFAALVFLPSAGFSQEKAQEKPQTKTQTKAKPAQQGKTATQKAPHADARHLGEESLGTGSSWYLDGAPRGARGAVWEQGVPMESLSRNRNHAVTTAPKSSVQGQPAQGQQAQSQQVQSQTGPHLPSAKGAGITPPAGTPPPVGVDTTKGIDSALGEISSYERQPADGSALGLNKPGVPSLQMSSEESSWRNPVTQPPTVGQEVMTTRRNVVGAYADVVKSDDLHVTVGPELHIPEADASAKRLSPQQNDSSTLGFGMKWQWDF